VPQAADALLLVMEACVAKLVFKNMKSPLGVNLAPRCELGHLGVNLATYG
jgi:hypothetical protein